MNGFFFSSQHFKYFTPLFSCVVSEKLDVIFIFVSLEVKSFIFLTSFKNQQQQPQCNFGISNIPAIAESGPHAYSVSSKCVFCLLVSLLHV